MKNRFARRALLGLSLITVSAYLASACSATGGKTTGTGGGGGEGGDSVGPGSGGDGGNVFVGAGGGGNGGPGGDPTTCDEAAMYRTYIGCDFWPTVVANNVWSVFDYAVVVANAGDQPAEVTVTRGAQSISTTTVDPNSLAKIYLPWVKNLKGPDADSCGSATPLTATVREIDGAYHLVSSRPVTVYQFNALEYAPQGGPSGKNWSSCPAPQCPLGPLECFSYSNDASLLLPSTAMTGNYRVTSQQGWNAADIGAYFAVTGTADGTSVQVKISGKGNLLAGGGIPATGPNGLAQFSLNRGEVVELVFSPSSDPAGSLVYADKPVQVISGLPCMQMPIGTSACDHIEEAVLPAETLGKHYFVVPPTSPKGGTAGHVVRIYGNVDGTQLSYPGGNPPNAPLSINAGQVFELGVVKTPFEVLGDHEFAVGSFQLGAKLIDPLAGQQAKGDPAQSNVIAVEQFRTKYVFLAPNDYDISVVDIVQPMSAKINLDGMDVGQPPVAISSNYGINRVTLGPGNNGAHVLLATEAVGIQVVGYGSYTSYQYPGGMNLKTIAPPPPPPN